MPSLGCTTGLLAEAARAGMHLGLRCCWLSPQKHSIFANRLENCTTTAVVNDKNVENAKISYIVNLVICLAKGIL